MVKRTLTGSEREELEQLRACVKAAGEGSIEDLLSKCVRDALSTGGDPSSPYWTAARASRTTLQLALADLAARSFIDPDKLREALLARSYSIHDVEMMQEALSVSLQDPRIDATDQELARRLRAAYTSYPAHVDHLIAMTNAIAKVIRPYMMASVARAIQALNDEKTVSDEEPPVCDDYIDPKGAGGFTCMRCGHSIEEHKV